MTLSPFLGGAIAAKERMADAQRDAERRRLGRMIESDHRARSWLLSLLTQLFHRASGSQRHRRVREHVYRSSQAVQSTKS